MGTETQVVICSQLQELLNKLTRNKAGFDNQAQVVQAFQTSFFGRVLWVTSLQSSLTKMGGFSKPGCCECWWTNVFGNDFWQPHPSSRPSFTKVHFMLFWWEKVLYSPIAIVSSAYFSIISCFWWVWEEVRFTVSQNLMHGSYRLQPNWSSWVENHDIASQIVFHD